MSVVTRQEFNDLVQAVAQMKTAFEAARDKQELGQFSTAQDLQNIENGILLTDLELRLLELEATK